MAEPAQTSLLAFLFTDIVGSTELKRRLGDVEGAQVIAAHDAAFRKCVAESKGVEQNNPGDGFFATFPVPSAALTCALAFQDALAKQSVEARVGIHMGEAVHVPGAGDDPKLLGLAVDTAGRVMSLALPKQILITRHAFDSARQQVLHGPNEAHVVWRAHGPYRFKGLDEPIEIHEAGIKGVAPLSPPPDSQKAQRAIAPGDDETLGWRPGVGLDIPSRAGWRLERELGAGGFGEVWLAISKRTKERRAFKFCYRADRLRNLKRELTLFRLLKETLGERDDIARLYDVRLDEAPFFLEMEYTTDGSLDRWAAKNEGLKSMSLEDRAQFVAEVAEALGAAHSVGVLHKDVKPSNILVRKAADGRAHARLTDFGIGQLLHPAVLKAAQVTATGFTETALTDLGSRTGTRLYMAPELFAGKPASIASDVYALGVLLYQMSVGDLKRPLAQGWERDIPDPVLAEDIAACIAGNPKERPASCDLVAERLRALEERRQRRAASEQMRVELARQRVRAGRRKLIAGAAIFLLAVVTIVTLVIAAGSHRQRRDAQAQTQQMLRQLKAKDRVVRAEKLARAEAIADGADLFAHISGSLLAQGDVAAAKLVAAWALNMTPTPVAWRALAAAEARSTPTLVTVLRGVANGPVALGRWRLYVSTADDVKEFLIATGEYGKTFAAEDVVLLAISPDGTRLAAFERGGTSLVWDTLGGEVVHELDTNRVLPTVAVFSYDNRFVYIGRENGSVVMLDLKKHEDAEYITSKSAAVSAMSVDRNGRRLYTGLSDGKIDRWRLPALVSWVDSLTPAKARILHVSASRNGESVYACTANHLVIATEIDSGDDFTMYRGPERELAFAVPTRNHLKLYTASKQGAIAVWNLEQHRLQARVRNLNAAIDSFAISSDGSRLAVASGGDVYVWALDEAWGVGAREPITALAQAASGKRLWLARPDHSIELWDSENGRSLARWPAHTATITALAVDGDRLLSASLDGTIAVWPLGGGKATVRFDGPGAPTAIAVDAQGTIHTGNISGEIEVWSLRRVRRISRLVDPGPLPIVAIRIEGQHLQSWDTAGTWRGWNLSTRNPEPGEGAPLPAATISGKSPAILGEAVDWIRKSERRRLVDTESRYGIKLNGAVVEHVSAAVYPLKKRRTVPWSKR